MSRKQEERGSEEEAKSFLTKRQAQVLQFRLQGRTQQESAAASFLIIAFAINVIIKIGRFPLKRD